MSLRTKMKCHSKEEGDNEPETVGSTLSIDGETMIDEHSIPNRSPRGSIMRSFYHNHCTYLPAMLGWFISSALLSSYNKFIFGEKHYHFSCPLLMTSIHFLCQWGFAHAVSEVAPVTVGTNRIREMSWNEWFWISVPCGIVTSGDVGLSNLSLVHISISFYTMIKASAPIFVLAWAYILGIEKITVALLLVVFIIAVGEFLTVSAEGNELNITGFLLCLSASFLSGARWTLVQLKLRSMDPPLKTVIATMRLISPSMFGSLLVMSMAVERPWKQLVHNDMKETLTVIGLALVGANLAVSMVLCEFWLIMRANAIVLMIGGVVKEMITILIGVIFFGDKLNRINISGCIVVFMGVVLYKVIHYIDAQENETLYHTAETEELSTIDTDHLSDAEASNDNGSGRLPSQFYYGKDDSGDDLSVNRNHDSSDVMLREASEKGLELRRKHEVSTKHSVNSTHLRSQDSPKTPQRQLV